MEGRRGGGIREVKDVKAEKERWLFISSLGPDVNLSWSVF